MKKYTLVTPEGMRDSLFEECKKRRKIENQLCEIAENRGYNEIATPIFEFYDVFNHSSLNFPQENLYKFTDNKGRLMVLRPDVSLPVARSVATRLRNEKLPLRLFYIQDVFRVNRADTGKSSCIRQAGVELIGKENISEVICLAIEFLKSFGKPFTVEIGHVGIFNHLTHYLKKEKGNEDYEKIDLLRDLIARKNSPALNKMDICEGLKKLPKMFGKDEILNTDLYPTEILNELKTIYDSISEKADVIIDLGLVNQINYYTGIVVKGYISGVEVLSGGRYDKLMSKFGYETSAMGFALYLDNIV